MYSTSSTFWCLSGIRKPLFGGLCEMPPHIMSWRYQPACIILDISISDHPRSQPRHHENYDSITMKSFNSMRYMEFLICTFDNSQITKCLKFHADGHSSSVTLVTSRMYIKPMVPHGLNIFWFPIARLEITYLHQKIPPAYDMAVLDDITSINSDVYSNIKYCTVNSATDITGAQV